MPHGEDPKALLARWCRQRGLPPPAFVADRIAGGMVEVVGSVSVGAGRYVRARSQALREKEAELEVTRDLFVQVQAVAGPIERPAALPPRETARERVVRQTSERQAAREALAREARRRGAYTFIRADADAARGKWTAQGLWQVGRAQTSAGPFEASTRAGAEAKVIAHLLGLVTGREMKDDAAAG